MTSDKQVVRTVTVAKVLAELGFFGKYEDNTEMAGLIIRGLAGLLDEEYEQGYKDGLVRIPQLLERRDA